jgi:hypothetical protein
MGGYDDLMAEGRFEGIRTHPDETHDREGGIMHRKNRFGILLALGGIILGALPLFAQNPEEPPTEHKAVAGFKERIYQLEDQGLKDLAVVLNTPLFRAGGIFKHIKVMVYYKTPDRHCLDILGLPEETRDIYLKTLKPVSTLTRYLFGLGSILVKVLKDSEVEVTREEKLFKIKAVPKTEALRKEFQRITLWVDESFKPVRIFQESPDLGAITVQLTMVEEKGKYLLSALRVNGVKGIEGEVRMKIKYETIEKKYRLPATIQLVMVKKGEGEAPVEGEPQDFHFKEYQINKGLDDSIFKKEKKPEDKEKEEEGY